ncbi:MAG: hypothetical protein GYB31_04660 [Bacteroidetes bacterium]|nr:hypothetical protein [Bacteroidota bacterium]
MKKEFHLKPQYAKILFGGGFLIVAGGLLFYNYFGREQGGIILAILAGILTLLGGSFIQNVFRKLKIDFEIREDEFIVRESRIQGNRSADSGLAVPIKKIGHLWIEKNAVASFAFFQLSITNLMVSYKNKPKEAYILIRTGTNYFQPVPEDELRQILQEVSKTGSGIELGAPEKYKTQHDSIGPARKLA